MEFHAFADEYPMMPAYELGRMEQGMRQYGFDARFPIVRFKGKILDGRNRFRASQAAGVKPMFVDFSGTEEEAKQFVQRANEERRHLATEWLHLRRQERIHRVAEARSGGESLRTIAESEGISVAQVSRDLEEVSTVPGGTVEPEDGKITGKDGRKRGPRKKRAPKPDGKVVDAFGVEVPKPLRAAYEDPWIQKAIDYLGVAEVNLRKERLADGMHKRAKHYPFINAKDFIDGVGFAMNYLDQILNHLKDNRPAGVCPSCDGGGCADCKMCGLVPRELHARLKKGKKK